MSVTTYSYTMKQLHHMLYRLKYRYGQYLPLTSPVDISLELSSLCNMGCSYCYHADKKNLPFKMRFMKLETAREILDQAAALGVNSIKTNWRGESTMNPHFGEITAHAKQLARGSTFIDRLTNSNFKFDTARDDIFRGLCNQTKVKVSYDSFNKQIFETQRTLGNHDVTTANIHKFYNYPGRDNILVIQAVRTQANKDEDFEGEIKKRWPSALLSVRDVVEGRLDRDISDMTVHEKVQERQSCLQAHVRLIFDWEGRPTVCCPDIKNKLSQMGTIHETSMDQMFNSAFAKQLRRDLKSGKAFESDPCKTCSSHETYKGYRPAWNS